MKVVQANGKVVGLLPDDTDEFAYMENVIDALGDSVHAVQIFKVTVLDPNPEAIELGVGVLYPVAAGQPRGKRIIRRVDRNG